MAGVAGRYLWHSTIALDDLSQRAMQGNSAGELALIFNRDDVGALAVRGLSYSAECSPLLYLYR